MKIIVNEKNRDKINEAVKAAEARASARCIDYDRIVGAIDTIDDKLGISKANQVGIRAVVDYWAQFPSAYKYTPESTQFAMVRMPSGWAITDIYRDRTKAPSKAIELTLTEKAKTAIIKAREAFEI